MKTSYGEAVLADLGDFTYFLPKRIGNAFTKKDLEDHSEPDNLFIKYKGRKDDDFRAPIFELLLK